MKLYPDKLTAHLQKQTAPIYLLHGDEPLQIMELGDCLREHARTQGFEEREVLHVSDDADWSAFRESADSLSLFAERRLIELRMPTGKPGRAGADVLKQYCENPPDDILLLITSGKLERAGSSAWFKAIDKVGVTIAVWPVPADKLSRWLAERLQRHGLRATADALSLIAERVEGNLLAADQEVARLALLYPAGELQAEQVLAAVADSARYSINDLTLAALQGNAVRALRIVRGLRDEAVAPMLVLWSLSQEIRSGARAAEAHAEGLSLDAALKAAGVWPSRAGPLRQATERHSVSAWLSMLARVSHIDRQIKGQAAGDVWDAFEALCVQLAGRGEVVLSNEVPITGASV